MSDVDIVNELGRALEALVNALTSQTANPDAETLQGMTPAQIAALVTKSSLGLDKVENYAPATAQDVTTGTALDKIMTVARTKAMIDAAIAVLVGSSSAALDTIYELAEALGNDPNFSATVMNQLSLKAPLDSPALTGNPTAPTQALTDLSQRIVNTNLLWQAIRSVGLGRTDYQPPWPNTSLNNCANVGSGVYRTIATTTDFPGSGATRNIVEYYIRDAATAGAFIAEQTVTDCITTKKYFRSSTAGDPATPTWSAWKEISTLGQKMNGTTTYTATGNISVADLSTVLVAAGTAVMSLTLPDISLVDIGTIVYFVNRANFTVSFKTASGLMSNGVGGSSNFYPINYGESVILSREASGWVIIGGSFQLKYLTLITDKATLASPAFTGNPVAPTQPYNTNGTTLSTTAFVQAARGKFKDITSFSASATALLASAGTLFVLNGASPFTLTLFDLTLTELGTELAFVNTNLGAVTIVPAVGQTMHSGGGTITSVVVYPGDNLRMIRGNVGWTLIGGSAQFIYSSGQKAARNLTVSPNLLLNGDMQINQRGFAGGALALNAYGYDRWKSGSSTTNIGAGTNLVITQAAGIVQQIIENGGVNFAGQQITISVEDPSANLTVSVQASSGTTTQISGTLPAGTGRQGVTLTVPTGATGNLTVAIQVSSSTTYKRVKAELGDTFTAWEQRPRALEVAGCHRYYYRNVQKTYVAQGVIRGSGNSASFFYPLLTRMRATPTGIVNTAGTVFNINGASAVNLGSGTQTISIPGVDNVTINAAGITVSTAGQPATIDNIDFSLDAEL